MQLIIQTKTPIHGNTFLEWRVGATISYQRVGKKPNLPKNLFFFFYNGKIILENEWSQRIKQLAGHDVDGPYPKYWDNHNIAAHPVDGN